MFNIDLKTISGMESHRGIAYVVFIAAVFPPSFLALCKFDAPLVAQNLLFASIEALCIGLVFTVGCVVTLFVAATDPLDPRSMKIQGAKSLALGSAVSFFCQAGGLFLLLLLPGLIQTLRGYLLTVTALCVVFAFFALSVGVAIGAKNKRERAKAGP